MKIIVLNGSPKGDISVTMQYIKYIQNNYTEHDFVIHNVCNQINRISSDSDFLDMILEDIKSSDGVIWAFPLYVYTVHSNYHRFIELIYEKNLSKIFENKYSAIICTSIHFFDHTAINYINSISDDLNMNFIGHFSAHMQDLKVKSKRKDLKIFMDNFLMNIENSYVSQKNYYPVSHYDFDYIPTTDFLPIDTHDKKITILTDSLSNNNLRKMIDRLSSSFNSPVKLINLEDIDIKGGCLGCIKCGYDYNCVYGNTDGYLELFNRLKKADILVFAGEIKHRYLSSRWKLFFDRSFVNTHTPSLMNKQFCFMLTGSLSQNQNLREILSAYTEWQRSNLAGFITDECSTSESTDAKIYALANNLINLSLSNYVKPATFLGIGGMRIFRDEIWGDLRFPFVADHKAYKRLGVYDFPHKDYKSRVLNQIIIFLCRFPSIRKKVYSSDMNVQMASQFREFIKAEG